eukprot:COSAG04_NODE_16269_length_504_cov_5.760494_2_plen_60_part_01
MLRFEPGHLGQKRKRSVDLSLPPQQHRVAQRSRALVAAPELRRQRLHPGCDLDAADGRFA